MSIDYFKISYTVNKKQYYTVKKIQTFFLKKSCTDNKEQEYTYEVI